MALSHQETWRFVPVITAGVAALQILLGPMMQESPVWLSHKVGFPETSPTAEGSSFRSDVDAGKSVFHPPCVDKEGLMEETSGVRERLLNEEATDAEESLQARSISKPPPQTIWGVMTSPLTRKGLRIVTITQIAQQASGINAGQHLVIATILLYGTNISRLSIQLYTTRPTS